MTPRKFIKSFWKSILGAIIVALGTYYHFRPEIGSGQFKNYAIEGPSLQISHGKGHEFLTVYPGGARVLWVNMETGEVSYSNGSSEKKFDHKYDEYMCNLFSGCSR